MDWKANRAQFRRQGHTLTDPTQAHTLEPLSPEGLYRVTEAFTCCPKRCRTYEAEQLVQLGYNAAAEPILFVPHWGPDGLVLPDRGHRAEPAALQRLAAMRVAAAHKRESSTSDIAPPESLH